MILVLFLLCAAAGAWFLYSEIYSAESVDADRISFDILEGESVVALAARLEENRVVRHAWLFRKYVGWKGIDKDVRFGTYEVTAPITLDRVVRALSHPSMLEREITILPGWSLRDIGAYLDREGVVDADSFFALVGEAAVNYAGASASAPYLDFDLPVLRGKLPTVSYEGYLAPDTYRIFKDATAEDIVRRLVEERDNQFTEEMYRDIERAGRTVYDVLTLASIVEREVRTPEDRTLVADIFWRRYDRNWALQADSTVHYAVNKTGDVFTTSEDRASLSPWNTYQYPGLPLGPISAPSRSSIMAAIYPEHNDYWYFLTTDEGEVKYAETLEGHNANRIRYIY